MSLIIFAILVSTIFGQPFDHLAEIVLNGKLRHYHQVAEKIIQNPESFWKFAKSIDEV